MTGKRTHLLIPIHIDALRVPGDVRLRTTMNAAPQFSLLKDDYYIGADLRAPTRLSKELEHGIHLHFRLPTPSAHRKSGGEFPRIPNRWLVQRYYKTDSGVLRVKAWLIYGDKAWLIYGDKKAPSNKSAIELPVFDAAKPGTPLELPPTGVAELIWDENKGKAAPYDYSEDDKKAEVELTAVTGGDAGFSAHYPACRSILGFYDALEPQEAKEAELTYLVAGWYSGKDDDPCSKLVSGLPGLPARADGQPLKWGQLNSDAKLEVNKWMAEYRCGKKKSGGKDPALGFDDDDPVPDGILCHGRVTGVIWKKGASANTKRLPEGLGKPGEYWIDIGNTSAEAFAARVAAELLNSPAFKKSPDKHHQQALLEDLVTAFQTGLLSEGTDFSAVDTELHRQGFASVAGGGIWIIEPEARETSSSNASEAEGQRRPPALLPAELQEKLDKLNDSEREYDRHLRRFRDYQWELYALWHRKTYESQHRDPKKLQENKALETSLEKLKSFLEGYWKEPSEAYKAKSKRDAAREGLPGFLDAYNKRAETTTKYVLPNQRGSQPPDVPQQPAAPFYMPNDPVLLLSGAGMRAENTRARKDGILPCRVTGEELRCFTYDVSNEQAGLMVKASKVDSLDGESAELEGKASKAARLAELLKFAEDYLKAIPPWCSRLLQEALLQDDMAEKAADSANKCETVQPMFRAVLPDEYGVFPWRGNPWIPVYVYWKIAWRDEFAEDAIAENVIPENVVKDRWSLDSRAGGDLRRNTDLLPVGKLQSGDKQDLEVDGLTFPGIPLVDLQADRFEKGSKARDLLGKIEDLMGNRRHLMMSVALGGFHDALILRRAGDQMPPLNYEDWNMPGDTFTLDKIEEALGPDFHPASSPETRPDRKGLFCPVRVGSLKVKELRVIDAFGQTFEIPLEDIRSEMKSALAKKGSAPPFVHSGRLVSGMEPGHPEWFPLPPRFCRPLRLEFKGVPAGTPIAGASPSTPVCGWVVVNHFDQNLILYASNGRPVSILQKRYNPKPLEHSSYYYPVEVPGASRDGAANDGILDEHLKDFESFVRSLGLAEGEAFDQLLKKAVDSAGERTPEENPAVSLLVGRPLALVRTQLCFEADGLPALDQEKSWIAQGQPSVEDILKDSLTANPPPLPNRFMVTGNRGPHLAAAPAHGKGVEDVLFPLRLGDGRSASDGLIGFFLGKPGSRPFYASPGLGFEEVMARLELTKKTSNLNSKQDLHLDGRKPLQVTLLMDPQARVHATSGILPRVFFQLPAAELAAARQVREVFFQTAPVLGTPATPQVPKPSDDYGQWSWAYRPGVTGWQDNPELVSVSDRADFSMGWPTLAEGWLKLKIQPVRVTGLWVSAPAQRPEKGTNVTLAWSVQSADYVRLFRLPAAGTDAKEEELDIRIHEEQGKKPEHPRFLRQLPVEIHRETTFELRASDKAGYADTRKITIQVKD